MQQEPPPYLSQRFCNLIWSCLDSDLTKTALFYAERYHAMNQSNHDAIHIYALTLLRDTQPYTALHFVARPTGAQCNGCLEIKAKCLTALGRHRQAHDTLQAINYNLGYAPSTSTDSRTARSFPEEAAIKCRSGSMAMRGNLRQEAVTCFRHALTLNPLLWEAFEGLCTLGTVPEVDEIFPPRPLPIKRTSPEVEPPPKFDIGPVATGTGFFTPDNNNVGATVIRGGWNPQGPQPFRIAPPVGLRESNNSLIHAPEPSFHLRPSRTQGMAPGIQQAGAVRPLSSADEAGPVTKKLRSSSRQLQTLATKPSKAGVEPPRKAHNAPTKPTQGIKAANAGVVTRRSSRLQGGGPTKPQQAAKTRERRRHQLAHPNSRSVDSDGEADVAYPPSPPSIAHSPRSEVSPVPSNWTAAHEAASQEAYELELADHYLYTLMRRFAAAARALAMFDCQRCLDELGQLPYVHQQSSWVLAMVGRAEFERLDYEAAERAFRAVRAIDPHRLRDMELYSTLLWHLQNRVQLSYLAQELVAINPRAPQTWIAVGNLFSLEKERPQALTCFRRAFEMDPECAYAYTLSGHECIEDDLTKAANFFQSALRADPRHYNAWYGLGTCYLRSDKLRLADFHYRKALEIHPQNAVLLGCVGMVAERRGDRHGALAVFDKAVHMSPENALVRYRRAKLHISMKRYATAIDDLERLYRDSPDESNVVFQLAKVYRLTGDETKAAQMLAAARDISPKGVNKIKKLLETAKDETIEDKMEEG